MLLTLQRQKILDVVRSVQPKNKWKIVLFDEATRNLVENVLKIGELLDENVSAIEQVEEKRTPNPSFEAVYILSPLSHVIDCAISDYARVVPRYHKAHFFFTSELPDPLFEQLKASPARPHLAIVTGIYIDYNPLEAYVFSTTDKYAMQKLYNPSCRSLVKRTIHSTARKILHVCITLGELPLIRFHNNPFSHALAKATSEELDRYAEISPEFPPGSSRSRATLIITDRAFDLTSPVVHEFTYQAMAHDVLHIRGRKYKFRIEGPDGVEEKDAQLGEEDKLWTQLRHLHMKNAIENITADMDKFRKQNPGLGESSSKATTVNDLKDMLAAMPHYAEKKEAFSVHLGMATRCMEIFEKNRLAALAAIEQDLATGTSSDGKALKGALEQLVPILDGDFHGTDKLRLIILFILYRQGILESDRQKLLQHSNLSSHDDRTLLNLEYLGSRITRELKHPHSVKTARKAHVLPGKDDAYELSRYDPLIKTVIQEHCKGLLDDKTWPYVKDAPATDSLPTQGSLRSARPTWAKSRNTANEPRSRVIVFCAGGAIFSESRACAELCSTLNKDVILGTDQMLAPRDFLGEVYRFSIPREGLHLDVDRPEPTAPSHLFHDDSRPSDPTPQASQKQQSLQQTAQRSRPLAQPVSYPPPPSPALAEPVKTPKKKKKFGMF